MIRLFFPFAFLALVGCTEPPEAQTDDADTAGSGQMQTDTRQLQPEPVDMGQAYLHINARKPGVKVMESGLQFEMIESGEGRSPSITSRVVTHYHGTFVNGDVFDSSVDKGEPASFPVNGVIRGWTEALQMMKEGDVWRLVIPPHLAYGEQGVNGLIPPNSVLVFEVELIEVKGG